MDANIFLTLLDEVLVGAGRQPLDANTRKIVSVEPTDRVLQILAGPGSGKTEMLVWRVLYDVIVRGTPSRRVMVTTFTRKAATELSVRLVERSDQLLARAHARGIALPDPRVHDLRVGTIHSLCDALLAEFDAKYMAEGTQLIDETEAMVRLIRVHRSEIGYTNPPAAPRALNRLLDRGPLVALFRAPWDADDRWPGNAVQRIQFLMACLAQHSETWIPRCGQTNAKNGVELVHKTTCSGLTDDLVKARMRWTAYLDKHNIVDFTTLQLRFIERQALLLKELDHVLVDEFQDTNPIQFALHTAWLAAPSLRLTVVGDDDQALYRFRGSDFECFTQLAPHCSALGVGYRLEKLEKNWRSTRAIVRVSQAYKQATVLRDVSMPKNVVPGDDAVDGDAVRLLRGPWSDLVSVVADEIAARTPPGSNLDPSTAALFFSTSEKSSGNPAVSLRASLGARGLRVFNARSKTAGRSESPVAELLALLSYLIDPVAQAPVGKNGRQVEVWATMRNQAQAAHARAVRPSFNISDAHAAFQKKFVKATGKIGAPGSDRADLFAYLDQIRALLASANASAKKPRLTLAGLVARLLSFPRYRNSGYTVALFRQALFTELLEANVAPTRRTYHPLDAPLNVEMSGSQFKWSDEFWSFLGTFGSLLAESDLDDPEVEAFEDGAVVVMTFHQAKGLEFDHVYVAGTGRDVSQHSVLQTMLFSGKATKFKVDGVQPRSADATVSKFAEADREREIYVAMTRAKRTLTFLVDPDDDRPFMSLNPGLVKLVKRTAKPYSGRPNVEIVEL